MPDMTRGKKEAPSPENWLSCFIIHGSLGLRPCITSGLSAVFIEKAIWSDKDNDTVLLILLVCLQLERRGSNLDVAVFCVCVYKETYFSTPL